MTPHPFLVKKPSISRFTMGSIVIPVILGLLLCSFSGCRRSVDKSSMVNKIKHIAKLATVEFKLRKIIFAEKKKKFFFFGLGKATYVSWVEPLIKAGVDISKITPNDVSIDEENKLITIQLPPIEIIDYNFNEESIKVDYSLTKDKVLNRFNLNDMEIINRNADKDIRTYLNFLGIREEAEKSTRSFFTSFFNSLGYNADISFKSTSQPLLFFDMDREETEDGGAQ